MRAKHGWWLSTGKHPYSDDYCLMEAVSKARGQAKTDYPDGIMPYLSRICQGVNDRLPDKERQLLIPLISVMSAIDGELPFSEEECNLVAETSDACERWGGSDNVQAFVKAVSDAIVNSQAREKLRLTPEPETPRKTEKKPEAPRKEEAESRELSAPGELSKPSNKAFEGFLQMLMKVDGRKKPPVLSESLDLDEEVPAKTPVPLQLEVSR